MISYLQIENLTKSFGDRILFENISLGIGEGDRVGLIAKNGAGKTTLLNILAGKEDYDNGQITCRNGLRVGYLEQSPSYAPELTVIEACFQSDNETVRLIADYERALQANDPDRLQELLDRMEHAKAWDYEQRAKQILSQLKITHFDQPIRELSGGQLKRLALANVLITEPDLLILDEPTNHLDMRTKDVLKQALKEFDGTLIVVSHDREFLDGLVSKVYEFGQQRVREHLGGIYDFLAAKKMSSLKELEMKAKPAEKSQPNAVVKNSVQTTTDNKLAFEARKEAQKKVKRQERAVADTEQRLAKLEAEIADIEARLATPEGMADIDLCMKHGALKKDADALTELWLEQTETLEQLRKETM